MRKTILIFCLGCSCFSGLVRAQATRKADDAAELYRKAGELIAFNEKQDICCPAASNMEYQPYPPFSAEWMAREKVDFAANGAARKISHEARFIGHADWPWRVSVPPEVSYLNLARGTANELGDAGLWHHVQGDDAAAVESVRDCFHLADLLENQREKKFILSLVGMGIRGLAVDRLDVIVSGADFSKDAGKAIQVGVARELIANLLDHLDAESELKQIPAAEGEKPDWSVEPVRSRMIETEKRVIVERDMCAMSLACHLYRFESGRWPGSVEDLKVYLPSIPVDVFGDGKQTLGYVLVKRGLPDGSDRPLVYSRELSKSGLFVRTEQPFYSFYGDGDGSSLPYAERKQGGQFRDVASWAPTGKWPVAAATQAVVR